MPVAITPPPAFDPAAAASKLPPSLQWLGGAAGSIAKDLTGGGDPNQAVMGMGNPMMAADTELSPLAQALYSRVQKVADALPEWIHPAKAASLFKNHASKEELDYRGVNDLLANTQGPDKISKATIQEHLAANPVPQVGVKTLQVPRDAYQSTSFSPQTKYEPVQYSRPDLNVPGGKNYTESLFTFPDKRSSLENAMNKVGDADATQEGIAEYERLRDELSRTSSLTPTYTSSHWDTPNVLAHTREDIRPDAYGVPGKFLQEVQSDWHQQGMNEGYNTPITKLPDGFKVSKPANGNGYLVTGAGAGEFNGYAPTPEEAEKLFIDRYNSAKKSSGVPDAPFKDSWPDLTLKKHVLDVANSPDQQWLGFTKGQTQADRYNLANHVDRLEYEVTGSGPEGEPTNGHLWGYKGGDTVFHKPDMAPETASQFIGAGPAAKLFSPENIEKWRQGYSGGGPSYNPMITGEDMTLGGEGMKHFYDQVLPSRLGKILKPFGGSVEEGAVQLAKPQFRNSVTTIDTPGQTSHPLVTPRRSLVGQVFDNNNDSLATTWPPTPSSPSAGIETHDLVDQLTNQIRNQSPTPTAPAWMARLTPEMKEAIKKQGLPLMSLLLARHLANHNALINPPDQSGQ